VSDIERFHKDSCGLIHASGTLFFSQIAPAYSLFPPTFCGTICIVLGRWTRVSFASLILVAHLSRHNPFISFEYSQTLLFSAAAQESFCLVGFQSHILYQRGAKIIISRTAPPFSEISVFGEPPASPPKISFQALQILWL
jgi:hypothetical protein